MGQRESATASEPSVWRNTSFRLFLTARTVAVAGAAVSTIALPLLVYDLTGSPLATSITTTGAVAPYLLFGFVAGAVADRTNRRAVMLTAQACASAALLSVPGASALGSLAAAHVIAVAFGIGTAFVWFDAAAFGALPQIVGRSALPAANGALWTASTVADVSVPAVAGLVIGVIGPAWALGIDGASYVLAAALIAAATRRLPVVPRAGGPKPTVLTDIREGLSFLRRHTLLCPLTFLGFGNSLAQGAVTSLLVVYARTQLGVEAEGPALGVIWTAVALGGLAAAVSVPRLGRRYRVGAISIAAYATGTVALVGVLVADGLTLALPALVVYSWAATCAILNGIGVRQQLTPDRLQGRVNTTARMIAWGGTPLGAVGAGVIAQMSDVRSAYAAAVVCLGVTAVVAWCSPLRTHGDISRLLAEVAE
ncbi:MFS transporter [Rhodococcus triatomae]|nr:hypothetical protein G419_20735 [Rhodococcus triatomae BKS 15-14]